MWMKYKIPILLFGLAFLIRILFFPSAEELSNISSHSIALDGYYQIAQSLLAGHGFSRDLVHHIPDSMRTPLYPLFITGLVNIFNGYGAVFALQVFLGAISAVLSWLVAREFLSQSGAIAVGILVALEPMTAYLTGMMLTETLFMFSFLAATMCVLRFLQTQGMRVLALSAMLLGTATLVRPTTQYFPAILLLTLASASHFRITKRLIRQSSVALGIFFLCIAPWAYRNYVTFGTTELTAQPVSNMFFALTSSAIALQTGISYEQARTELFAREGVKMIDNIHLGTAAHFKERAIEEMEKYPIGFAKAIGIALITFFTHDGYANILDRYGIPISYQHPGLTTLVTNPALAFSFLVETMQKPEALVILGRIFWIVTTILAFLGGILYLAKHGLTPSFILFAGSIAYFALTTTVLGLAATGRFRVPVNPFIFIFAMYAVQWLYARYWQAPQTVPLLRETEEKLLLKK